MLKGSKALNINIEDNMIELIKSNCFGNVGILQTLILLMLDEESIFEKQRGNITITNSQSFNDAASKYADQLNSIYLKFAKTLSAGIKNRPNSTGIYAHAMAVIVDADDDELLHGLSKDKIFEIAHRRQPRIQKANLNTILKKLEELQVDKEGRGLVIAYDISSCEITAVDRQLLFYRKYRNMKWPWEELINELDGQNDIYQS